MGDDSPVRPGRLAPDGPDVAEAGHMVAGDRNDLFNDAVVSFLDDVKDQGA